MQRPQYLIYEYTMRLQFPSGEIDFYLLYDHEKEPILNNLRQSCGFYKIPDFICRKELTELPSPIRSSDFIACYTSGEIPAATSYFKNTILDVIREENNPRSFEPQYNVYRHYIIETSRGMHISEPVKPDHHWAASGELNEIYNF